MEVELVVGIGKSCKLYLSENLTTSSSQVFYLDVHARGLIRQHMLSLPLHEMAVSVLSVKSAWRKQLQSVFCHHLPQV